jgi:putative cell wall-binding protein
MIRSLMIVAIAASALLALPAVALAEDPPDAPETVYSSGFESADAALTLGKTDPAASAYWGPITQSKRSGSYGLYCSAQPANYWSTYAAGTRGQGFVDLPILRDYYDSWFEYYYIIPTRGAADTNSFGMGWYGEDDPGDWDLYNYFGTTGSWTRRVEEMSDPSNSPGISRQATTLVYVFNDKTEGGAQTPREGQGATIDDVTVTGYMFGPARSLTADAGSSSVPVSWQVPWRSREATSTEERSVKYRIWRRMLSPAAGSWSEMTTSGGQSGTTITDNMPPSGVHLEYRVHVWEDGGSGYSEATTIIVDQPPAVTDDAQASYTTPATITIDAVDTVDGVGMIQYVLDGAATQTVAADSTGVNVSSDGAHVLTYWAADTGGVTSDQVVRNFTIDTSGGDKTPPVVTDDAPSYSTNDPTSVTITAVDPGSGVSQLWYQVDGGTTQTVTAASASPSVAGEGEHTLTYYAEDNVGNVSTPAQNTFRIDTIVPNVGAAQSPDGSNDYHVTTPAQVTITASDAGSGVASVWYRVNSGGWSSTSMDTVVVDVSTEGENTVQYYAKDAAGNQASTKSETVYVDMTTPDVQDDVSPNPYGNRADIDIDVRDACPDGFTLYWDLDGGTTQTVPSGEAAPNWGDWHETVSTTALGMHTLTYYAEDAAGNRTAVFSEPFEVVQASSTSTRLADNDRFSTAVKIAREGFDADGNTSNGTDWDGITDVIIASGEDRAAADPLSASGLAWAEDAPLFLVSSSMTPHQVKVAVKEIASQAPGTVTVHIVGGTVSVPQARYNDLKSYVGGAGSLTYTRVAGNDRYTTAEEISKRVRAAYRAQNSGAEPPVVLIANGADSTKFFDALALSPIAAQNGYPILPVSASSVPAATERALRAIDPNTVVIGGGPNTVGSSVKNRIKAITGTTPQQWYGNDRYSTATRIATNAVNYSWLTDQTVGVAAKLPDALTGGSMVGRKQGVLLVTDGNNLSSAPRSWMSSHSGSILKCYVFGGVKSMTPNVKNQIDALLP